jgi:hypothetical protein
MGKKSLASTGNRRVGYAINVVIVGTAVGLYALVFVTLTEIIDLVKLLIQQAV